MSDKNGIEIDYCPSCRGIWLDRGELDKIIERSATHYSGKDNRDKDYRDHDKRDYHDNDYKRSGHYKKKSFLGDIFDF